MWTLGIESATLQGGVALSKDSEVVDRIDFEEGMVHGRDLIPAVQEVCNRRRLKVRDLHVIAVDIGPGSYTGLRVGLATAKGLCRFAGVPLIGVCSLDAMADDYMAGHSTLSPSTPLCPALDAKWNQIYYAFYSGGVRKEGPFADPPSALRSRDPRPLVFGDALLAFPDPLVRIGATLDPNPLYLRPTASAVARRGALDYGSGRRDTVVGLEPLYLRPTEAEMKLQPRRG